MVSIVEPRPPQTPAAPRPGRGNRWWWIGGFCLLAIPGLWFGRPWLAQLAVWRGCLALDARRFDAADDWFRRADAIAPARGEAQYWLARVERLRGRPERMQVHLQAAAERGWSAERLRREQVLAMAQSGRIREVAEELPVLLMDPRDDGPAICEAVVSGYMRAFRIAEALTILDAWRRDYPHDPQPLAVRGQYFSQRQTWARAAEEFEQALALAPSRDDIRVQWAEALRQLHRLEAAREQFERCLRGNPRDPAALLGLGRCRFESGELAAARELFERTLKVAPDSWDARLWLGKLLAADGHPADAVNWLEPVANERPYEPEARYALALALQAAGQTAAAREHFEFVSAQQTAQSELRNKLELLEREPQRVDLRYEIGKILLEYGNPVEGAIWLQSVLEVEPTHAAALAALAEYQRPPPDAPHANR